MKAAEIALSEKDIARLDQLKASIEPLDHYASDELSLKISALKQHTEAAH